MDDAIERFQNQILSLCMGLIPTSMIPYLLQTYVFSSWLMGIVWQQTKRTALAIFDSFFPEMLYIYQFNDVFVPFTLNSIEASPITNHVAYRYNKAKKEFLDDMTTGNVRKHYSPWIGATLYTTEPNVSPTSYDLSEWLSDIKIHNIDGFLPLQVLVIGWASDVGVKLHYPLFNYTITLMDLEGNEKQFNVFTEQEIKPTQDVVGETKDLEDTEELVGETKPLPNSPEDSESESESESETDETTNHED